MLIVELEVDVHVVVNIVAVVDVVVNIVAVVDVGVFVTDSFGVVVGVVTFLLVFERRFYR